jgi:hypothetical protein
MPETCLMDMPRNVFRLTPSFVTVASHNKADSHKAVDDFDVEQQGWLWLWLWRLWWWFWFLWWLWW